MNSQAAIVTTDPSIRNTILALYEEVVQGKDGASGAPLTDDTVLLESGLDSLGFAILVARLDEELGYDPFSLSDDPYYPQTFGEFVTFYESNRPS
ncbi:acyl carrier protein [Muricoccus nepalensis]|uniref:acyl carrier protein n=1 Tax=Muricoccus nepalensis TaxID=1854500 RepID=UPI0019D6A078|nr:acyl carrier protein [Roseomonas nepalensis]